MSSTCPGYLLFPDFTNGNHHHLCKWCDGHCYQLSVNLGYFVLSMSVSYSCHRFISPNRYGFFLAAEQAILHKYKVTHNNPL